MRQGMVAIGDGACVYFIMWIVIGHFTLLTLFLAILINNFSEIQEVPPEEGEESEEEQDNELETEFEEKDKVN